MKNLQKMISFSQNKLIEKEQQIKNQLENLDNYIDCMLCGENTNAISIDEKAFPKEVFDKLNESNLELNKLKNSLIKEKNSKIYSSNVKSAITSIANMKNCLKNVQNKIIYAQNAFALKGDIKNADKLAKISFELNYSNHMFVKKASADVVDIKQIMINN